MKSSAEKKQIVKHPEVFFEVPKFEVSSFGLAHRVIMAMRQAGISERDIQDYKNNVHGLIHSDTLIVSMYTVSVVL